MIAKKIAMKKSQLSSFKKLVEYLTDTQGKENRVGEISMHNYISSDMQWAMDETYSVQACSSVTTDKTYHLMFSFGVDEEVSEEVLKAIENKFIDALGYAEHQRISVVHKDTDNLHVHIAINKVHPEKLTTHEPYLDYKILSKVCRESEDEFNLQKLVKNQERSNDMDAQAGIQSLENWIRQECREPLQQAASWEQVNAILAEHGLTLKERGNGMVFSNGSIHVKASKIDREFSKFKLEKKLGKFDFKRPQDIEPKKEYIKRPNQRVDTTKMYENYQAYRDMAKEIADKRRKKLLRDKRQEMADLNASYSSKFSAANLIKDRNARKFIKAMLRYRKNMAQLDLNNKYRNLRKAAYVKPKVWADWLKDQAANGDIEATKILASRVQNTQNAYLRTNQIASSINGSRQFNAKINAATKQGSVTFKNASGIKDRGSYIKLANNPTDIEVLQALKIAKAKYGENLTLRGTEQFKLQVISLAANANFDISFKEPAHQKRLELLKHKNEVANYVRARQLTGRFNESGNRTTGITNTNRGDSNGFTRGSGLRAVDAGFRATAIGRYSHYTITSIAPIAARKFSAPTQNGVSMPTLRQLTVVYEQNRSEMLLPRNVHDYTQQQGTKSNPALRRGILTTERRINKNFNLQRELASNGQVLSPGDKPPEFLRGKLVHFSQIKVLEHGTQSDNKKQDNAEPIPVNKQHLEPIAKYIQERNEKIEKGFDIMNHRRYTSKDSGLLKFAGIRTVDEKKLALFESNNEVLVLSISDYAAKRLKDAQLGTLLEVRPNGQVVHTANKTRNR